MAILANRSISVKEALGLFGLLISQFVLGAAPRDARPARRLLHDGFRASTDELIHEDLGASALADER